MTMEIVKENLQELHAINKEDIGADEILELEAEMHQLLNSRGTSRV